MYHHRPLFRCALILAMLMMVVAPRSGHAQQDSEGPVEVTADVVYGHKDGLAMTYDVFRPKKDPRGVGVMFMVSGGWHSAWAPPEQLQQMFMPLLDAGYTVIAVRHGSSPRYVVPEIVADVHQALEHVSANASTHGIDPERLGVFGFSAGGHLSLVLGTGAGAPKGNGDAESPRPRVAAVVAIFPPTDLAPYVEPGNPLREQFPALQFDPERADEFSPLKHVSADDPPTLLVHGDQDELVPLWHSEKIHAALQQAGVASELMVIEGAGHGFDQSGNQRMVEAMLRWFDTHLAKP